MKSWPTEAQLRRRKWTRDHPVIFAAIMGPLWGAVYGLFSALRQGWSWAGFSTPLFVGVVLMSPAIWIMTRRAPGDDDD